MNFQEHYDTLPGGGFLYYSDTIPSAVGTGLTAKPGDLCLNIGLSGPTGWLCTVAGSPGTWVTIGTAGSYFTATGANNALVVTAPSVPLVAGSEIKVNTGAYTLQAGANTLAYNGAAAASIFKHTNKAANISTAYAAGSVISLTWDGVEWLDMSQ
jgi:hypothetical protein